MDVTFILIFVINPAEFARFIESDGSEIRLLGLKHFRNNCY